eukprot:jgi/Mesvir1/12745/Mv20420-RA.1
MTSGLAATYVANAVLPSFVQKVGGCTGARGATVKGEVARKSGFAGRHDTCRLLKSAHQASRQSSAYQTLCASPSGAELSRADEQMAMPSSMAKIGKEFQAVEDMQARMKMLIERGSSCPPLLDHERVNENRVMGCSARAWVAASLDSQGRLHYRADSDSAITRGMCAVLCEALSGMTCEEVIRTDPATVRTLNIPTGVVGLSRTAGLHNIFESMRRAARKLKEGAAGLAPFPSLLVSAHSIKAQGTFAEAQRAYLQPNPEAVTRLAQLLEKKKISVVAHFYMDPQVQGVLSSAAELWPHILISDSLLMADRAVRMVADSGCQRVVVLGVDFMSENVRAILDKSGFADVPVYRMSADEIGCSLADAAISDSYFKYLGQAALTPRSLHVVYINTSLETKARAHALVPTITCTSSNVVQTVLQAFAQIPDCTVWYGPDTYMGGNLCEMFKRLAVLSDEEIQAIHPAHNRSTLKALLPRLHYYQEGMCVVHDLFGEEVVKTTRELYGDAFQAAHFEVPGEMFALAMEAKSRNMGVVGSTANILDFITARTTEAIERDLPDERLQFVLGTESGMVTSIVRAVQALLREAEKAREGKPCELEVEIVFPVSSDAISRSPDSSAGGGSKGTVTAFGGQLAVVPGVQQGEGCSISGGCASCPYMKMNSLEALMKVCERIGTPGESLLSSYEPRKYQEGLGSRSLADVGVDPILHMRYFQQNKKFSDELVQDVLTRYTA